MKHHLLHHHQPKMKEGMNPSLAPKTPFDGFVRSSMEKGLTRQCSLSFYRASHYVEVCIEVTSLCDSLLTTLRSDLLHSRRAQSNFRQGPRDVHPIFSCKPYACLRLLDGAHSSLAKDWIEVALKRATGAHL